MKQNVHLALTNKLRPQAFNLGFALMRLHHGNVSRLSDAKAVLTARSS